MGSEWTTFSLGNVCTKIGSGATPRGGKEAYRGGATSLIRSQNIYNQGFIHDGIVYIDDSQADELSNAVVEINDVLLNITGDSVARCCQVAPDVLPARVNQHVAIVRPKIDILDPRFLRYLLVSPLMQAQLMALASAGATRNALTKGMIEGLVIQAPPLSEQLAISETLGVLDDRIDNLRKTNATLEAIAAALFKSWFVDFDGVPPEDMQESELGLIPKGWRIATVGEYFELTMGQSPPGNTYNETGDGMPFYQGRTDFGWRFPTERVYCAAPTRFAKKGNVMVSVRAPVGDINVSLNACAIGRGVAAVHSEFTSFALYVLLSLKPAFKQYESEGTVFGSINKKQFEELKFIAPPTYAVRDFESIVQPIDLQIENNYNTIKTLAALRDMLLPRLISGKLRIPGAGRQIVEVSV